MRENEPQTLGDLLSPSPPAYPYAPPGAPPSYSLQPPEATQDYPPPSGTGRVRSRMRAELQPTSMSDATEPVSHDPYAGRDEAGSLPPFSQRNAPYVRPGNNVYNTPLEPSQEAQFRKWVTSNDVPFDVTAPVSDYDMRGFYKALTAGNPLATSAVDPNDKQMHYPDYWKTPLHESFSNESQWATPDAPAWNDKDQLVDQQTGQVVFDDRANNAARPP